MKKIDNTILFSNLLQYYGGLLSKTQYFILDAYYNYDLSISEIANNNKISRAAVEDAIKKGQEKLIDIEKKINVLSKCSKTLEIVGKIEKKTNDKTIINYCNSIKGVLKNGI